MQSTGSISSWEGCPNSARPQYEMVNDESVVHQSSGSSKSSAVTLRASDRSQVSCSSDRRSAGTHVTRVPTQSYISRPRRREKCSIPPSVGRDAERVSATTRRRRTLPRWAASSSVRPCPPPPDEEEEEEGEEEEDDEDDEEDDEEDVGDADDVAEDDDEDDDAEDAPRSKTDCK